MFVADFLSRNYLQSTDNAEGEEKNTSSYDL